MSEDFEIVLASVICLVNDDEHQLELLIGILRHEILRWLRTIKIFR